MNTKKAVALVLLVFQTTVLVLTLRYSRSVPKEGPRSVSSSIVVVAELVKFICCCLVIAKSKGWKFANEIYTEVFLHPLETLKIAIPSGTYAMQNNLLFIALSYLDAPTYQVTYQLKILSSALFSVLLLGKSLNAKKWLSLFLLFVGVSLVQITPDASKSVEMKNRIVGLIAILVSCISSGFAGVYFEKILKGSRQSLWIRNIQMAIFGVIFGSFGVWWFDYDIIAKDGFFQGYDILTWFIVFLHAIGGLLIATVIKHADNIIKGFAASLSIIVSSVASFIIFDEFHVTPYFYLGATLVLVATFLYAQPSKEAFIKSRST